MNKKMFAEMTDEFKANYKEISNRQKQLSCSYHEIKRKNSKQAMDIRSTIDQKSKQFSFNKKDREKDFDLIRSRWQ